MVVKNENTRVELNEIPVLVLGGQDSHLSSSNYYPQKNPNNKIESVLESSYPGQLLRDKLRVDYEPRDITQKISA